MEERKERREGQTRRQQNKRCHLFHFEYAHDKTGLARDLLLVPEGNQRTLGKIKSGFDFFFF